RVGAEVPRAAVSPEVEVEDVVAFVGQVVHQAARRQMPGVAVLAVAMDHQHRRLGGAFEGALPDHRQRNAHAARRLALAREDDLLDESSAAIAVDGLLDLHAVQDHRAAYLAPTAGIGASFLSAARPGPRLG